MLAQSQSYQQSYPGFVLSCSSLQHAPSTCHAAHLCHSYIRAQQRTQMLQTIVPHWAQKRNWLRC
jgi:hypothetical protein